MNVQPSLPTEDEHAANVLRQHWLPRLGFTTIAWVRLALLAVIAALTFVATAIGIFDIVQAGRVGVSDVLLMFIYLEIWAMIAVEATLRRLPVNFIIYIAITVLTRHLVGIAGQKNATDTGLLVDGATILILAVAALLVEFSVQKMYRSMPATGVRPTPPAAEKPSQGT